MANGPTGTISDKTSGTTSKPGRQIPVQHKIEIKNADAVQGQLLEGAHWLEDNAKLVFAIITVAILAGLVYSVWTVIEKHQEKAAQEAYYSAEAPFAKKRDAFEKTKFKAFMPPDQNDKTPGEVATGDLAKDYAIVLPPMEKVAKDYAGTAGGSQAAILVAQTYLEYKNPDKAIEFAQIPATKLSKNNTLAVLGKMLWGSALSAKGDCQQALTVWQQILDTKSADYLANDVNLRMGTCLEKMGQSDRAAEAYRNASKGADSPASQSAKALLRDLELKTPVAAAAPAATSKEK